VYWASVSAPVKAFLDRVGGLLTEAKKLDQEGRTAGAFCTGGAISSGKEMARITILLAFLNFRFIVIGGVEPDGFGTFGAQATTGPADPGLSKEEKQEAHVFGSRFARLTHQIKSAGLK
jgi:NAD(P)H dehydrogenase (quinone)